MTDTTTEAQTWTQLMAPMVQRFKVASVIDGGQASWNSVGSAANAQLVASMAKEMDDARTLISTLRAALATAEAQAQTARDDALRDAADAALYADPREGVDAILAMIQPTPTTPRTDAATEE